MAHGPLRFRNGAEQEQRTRARTTRDRKKNSHVGYETHLVISTRGRIAASYPTLTDNENISDFSNHGNTQVCERHLHVPKRLRGSLDDDGAVLAPAARRGSTRTAAAERSTAVASSSVDVTAAAAAVVTSRGARSSAAAATLSAGVRRIAAELLRDLTSAEPAP